MLQARRKAFLNWLQQISLERRPAWGWSACSSYSSYSQHLGSASTSASPRWWVDDKDTSFLVNSSCYLCNKFFLSKYVLLSKCFKHRNLTNKNKKRKSHPCLLHHSIQNKPSHPAQSPILRDWKLKPTLLWAELESGNLPGLPMAL